MGGSFAAFRIADWLVRAARGRAYTSPSWTRSFSELLARMLRGHHSVDREGLMKAPREWGEELDARRKTL